MGDQPLQAILLLPHSVLPLSGMSEAGLEGPASLVRDSDGELRVDVIGLQHCAPATSAPGSELCMWPLYNSDDCLELQVTPQTEFPFEQSFEHAQTVMLRNIAYSYDKFSIAVILKEAGFQGCYDSIHVPTSKKGAKKSNMGYAFVGFKSRALAESCQQLFSGKIFGHSATMKLCEVSLAHHQEKIPFFARKKVERQMRRDPMDWGQD